MSLGITPQAHDIPLHPTHLHHSKVPLLCCDVKAAVAVVVRREEQVAAALLDEQLW
jgi:hypothetical protein